MLDAQRKINAKGGMKAMCILSVEFMKKIIAERIDVDENNSSNPSLILIDKDIVDNHKDVLSILKLHPKLAGVPLFFCASEFDSNVEEDCLLKGAMFIVEKPLQKSAILRIDNASWQYELSKNYERVLQKQISELETAKAIKKLNTQLESRNEFLYKVFGKYFSDELIDIILSKQDGDFIGGEKIHLAVLFSDLRGFTSVSEKMDPDSITDLLNKYFGTMSDVILGYGGTIIEFLGDGILAIFGAPSKNEKYVSNAIAAAIDMQNSMYKVNAYCEERGYEELQLGIGVHCGEGFVGNVGTERMMRYNVIGSVVNICSRIESYSIGGQVLVSEDVVNNSGVDLVISERKTMQGKGMSNQLQICSVSGIGGDYKCYLKEKDKAFVYKIAEDIIFEVCRMNNKILLAEGEKTWLKEFSKDKIKLFVKDVDRFQLYEDVEIRCNEDRRFAGFTNVYAKIVERLEDCIVLSLTRVNDQFKVFERVINKGKIKVELEWRADMKNRQDVCVISCDDFLGQDIKEYLSGVEEKFVLAWKENAEDVNLYFYSNDKAIRAVEFLDYIADNYGAIVGDGKFASTTITKVFLNHMMSEQDTGDINVWLEYKVDAYYSDCQWIFAEEYIKTEKKHIMELPLYRKKDMPWAYVKTVDIALEGTKFKMKSLENESSLELIASQDMYIMIGCRGEIYNISSDKFVTTYSVSDEKFDIFSQMPDYIPEVQLCETNEYISLDDKAYLCYPKNNKEIYAMPIECRTKVFSEHNKGEYFVGTSGDYMAIRKDDISDIYIIQREIFAQTYEKVKG